MLRKAKDTSQGCLLGDNRKVSSTRYTRSKSGKTKLTQAIEKLSTVSSETQIPPTDGLTQEEKEKLLTPLTSSNC
jgi:hypothetical protein